jgi:hypothetical protein
LETIVVENLIREADPVEVRRPGTSRRAVSIIAAIALVLGGVVLARAAAPNHAQKTHVVTNVDHGKAVVDGAGAVLGRSLGFGAVQPQIDVGGLIRAIVCPILSALATGPLGGFIGFVINPLRVAFGCASP